MWRKPVKALESAPVAVGLKSYRRTPDSLLETAKAIFLLLCPKSHRGSGSLSSCAQSERKTRTEKVAALFDARQCLAPCCSHINKRRQEFLLHSKYRCLAWCIRSFGLPASNVIFSFHSRPNAKQMCIEPGDFDVSLAR